MMRGHAFPIRGFPRSGARAPWLRMRVPLAMFDCEIEAVHEGGDHVILVGRVNELRHDPEGDPLLYYRGRYSTIET